MLEADPPTRHEQKAMLAICNTNGSQMVRVRRGASTPAPGPEIAWRPQTFLAQIAANYLLGLCLYGGPRPNTLTRSSASTELEAMPDLVARRSRHRTGGRAGPLVRPNVDRAVLGRHVGHPVAGGALKLKELAWHACRGFRRPARQARPGSR